MIGTEFEANRLQYSKVKDGGMLWFITSSYMSIKQRQIKAHIFGDIPTMLFPKKLSMVSGTEVAFGGELVITAIDYMPFSNQITIGKTWLK